MDSSTNKCKKAPVPYMFLGTKEIRNYMRFATSYQRQYTKYNKSKKVDRNNHSKSLLYNLWIVTACTYLCLQDFLQPFSLTLKVF